MKKFLIIFFISLLSVIGIGATVCYLVVPGQTKELFNLFVGYMNTPLGIIGGSSLTIGAVAFFVFKIVATYIVKNNKINLELHKKEVEKLIEQAKTYEEHANACYSNTKVVLSDFSNELDKLTTELIKVCETSPNAKIKKIADEIKGIDAEYRENINEKIISLDMVVNNNQTTIDELDKQVKELTDKIERLVKDYGERKETIND